MKIIKLDFGDIYYRYAYLIKENADELVIREIYDSEDYDSFKGIEYELSKNNNKYKEITEEELFAELL